MGSIVDEGTAGMGRPMDRSNRLFGREVPSFDQAYPMLNNATIEYYETGEGTEPFRGRKKEAYGTPVRVWTGLIPCSNPRCNRGGYEIDSDINGMVGSGQVTREFIASCKGDEGTPAGRRRGEPCSNELHYRLTLTYREEPLS